MRRFVIVLIVFLLVLNSSSALEWTRGTSFFDSLYTPILWAYNQTDGAIVWILEQGYIPNTNVVFDNESLLNDTYVEIAGDTMTGNLITSGNVTADFYYGDGRELTGIQHGALTLFLHNEASGVSGSKVLDTAANDTSIQILSVAITEDGQEFQNWTTDINVPGLPLLSDGIYEFHFHARVTSGGTKDTTIQAEIYKVDSTGGNPILLVTTEESFILTTDFVQEDIHIFGNEVALDITDRLLLKVIVRITGGGGNPTVELQIENGVESRLEIPSPSPTKEIFIPYIGAVKNIDIGDNTLSVKQLNASNWENVTIIESQITNLVHAVDTSAAVNCTSSEIFMGNGSCFDSDLFFDDTTIADTSAETECSGDQILFGNGSCYDSTPWFDDTDTVCGTSGICATVYEGGTALVSIYQAIGAYLTSTQLNNSYLRKITSFGGEVSGTYNNIVIGNDVLDDQYYDSEADLTTLLDDNYADIQWDYNQTKVDSVTANLTLTGTLLGINGANILTWLQNIFQPIGIYLTSTELNASYIVDLDLNSLSELNTQITDATFFDVCSTNNARVGTGCTDVLIETELDSLSKLNTQISETLITSAQINASYIVDLSLDTISELNSQITDVTSILYSNTLTNTKWCKAVGTGGDIDCDVEPVTDTDTHMGYTNIAMKNETNTFSLNQTLSSDLILSQDKNLYLGAGRQYYNGTCMIIVGSASIMEIC